MSKQPTRNFVRKPITELGISRKTLRMLAFAKRWQLLSPKEQRTAYAVLLASVRVGSLLQLVLAVYLAQRYEWENKRVVEPVDTVETLLRSACSERLYDLGYEQHMLSWHEELDKCDGNSAMRMRINSEYLGRIRSTALALLKYWWHRKRRSC